MKKIPENRMKKYYTIYGHKDGKAFELGKARSEGVAYMWAKSTAILYDFVFVKSGGKTIYTFQQEDVL